MMNRHKPIALMLGVGMAIASLPISVPSVLAQARDPSVQESPVTTESPSPSPTPSIPSELEVSLNKFNEVYELFSGSLEKLLAEDDYQGLSTLLKDIETSGQVLGEQVQALGESEYKASISQSWSDIQDTISKISEVIDLLAPEGASNNREIIAQVQRLVGVPDDGVYGEGTRSKIAEFLNTQSNQLKSQRDSLQAALQTYDASLPEPTPEPSPSPSPPPDVNEPGETSFVENLQNPTLLGTIIGLILLVVLAVVFVKLYRKRQQSQFNSSPQSSTESSQDTSYLEQTTSSSNEEMEKWIKSLISEEVAKQIKKEQLVSSTTDQSLAQRITNLENFLLKEVGSSKYYLQVLEGKTKQTAPSQGEFTPILSATDDLKSSLNSNHLLNWLQLYNKHSEPLELFAIIVMETENSFHQRISKQRQTPILERSLGGNYWIFQDQKNECFYLLPKRNLRFNKHSLEELQTFFQVNTDQWHRGSTFRVITPAIAVSLSNGEQWELKERGKMEFESEIGELDDAQT